MSLTDPDLKNIKNLVKVALDEDDTLVRRDDIKHLPDKNEFYEQTLKFWTNLISWKSQWILFLLRNRITEIELKL